MERKCWRMEQNSDKSVLLGVSSHIMYLVTTGRNAWNYTWSQRYKGTNSLHFDLAEAKQMAEDNRVQGTVFTIEQVPALAFRFGTGIAYCVEFHSQESFKMLKWSDPMHFLKIGTVMPEVMDVFSKPDSSLWEAPRPDQNSFITRVFDLVGNVNPTNGKTVPGEAEPLDGNAPLNLWTSHPSRSGPHLNWTKADLDRNVASVERVNERFNSLNSPQLKSAANTLFVANESFARCHYEENWTPPDPGLQVALEKLKSFAEKFTPPSGE